MVRRLASLLLLATSLGLLGCSSSPGTVKNEAAQDNLMKIGLAYARFNTQQQRPPASAQELLPFLKEAGASEAELRSPDDGEPYVVCWGEDLLNPADWVKPSTAAVLAYEQRGKDGKRYVMTRERFITRMTDAELRAASFPPGHQPP